MDPGNTDGMQAQPQVEVITANTGALAGIVHPYKQIYVHQVWELKCCFHTNKYMFHGGNSQDGPLLFTASEHSSCCERMCCEPYHGLRLSFETPDGQDLGIHAERVGCCSGKMCLCCCTCADICTSEMVLHDGVIPGPRDDWGKTVGEYKEPPKVIFRSKQAPACEAMFNPTIVTTDANGQEMSTMEGPCCFGGWSELFCSSNFPSVNKQANLKLGRVKKLRPETCMQLLCEVCTKSDRFMIDFEDNVHADQKAGMVVSTLLTDYLIFESDQGLCGRDSQSCYCTLCQMYCCGCIVNCILRLPNKD
jgi:hypothetical protein